ncbi:hypothetical protein GO730_16770 [Spirosoma sp. HMF3257]|uniref:DUF3108 domain-containing protein n=1 Tax=Spirosoma telluris TaxID=2183553 RepID=A0A327NSW8_9BACT|nr:hypothetical protein [Spirosoma telluris]RAI78481.1 hypothetical protein HMF3257_16700 [Spirosoma telluris]
MFWAYCACSVAQTPTEVGSAETHHYAIEIAGIRVGTMTAVRQPQADNQTIYTLISDVKVNLLVYTVKIYYKVINRFEGKKLMLSTVDVHTNRGDFTSRTEWKGDHYDINADQYKYKRQTIETQNIDFSSSLLYFYEPLGRNKVYAEYFGDYFTFSKTAAGTYHAVISDRADDYIYQNGRLVKIVKHNSLKNFILRLLD